MASRRTALGGAALLIALAAPASASAAGSVAPSVPCARYVVSGQALPTLGVAASGWAAGTPLTFKVAGQTVGSGTADATGAFTTGSNLLVPPAPTGNLQATTLTAEDGAGNVASAPLSIVRFTVVLPKGRHKPSEQVKYRAFGFQPGRKLYVFVRRGGKTKGRFPVGVAKGDCGLVTKKMRFFPLKRYKLGTYKVWFMQSRTFSTANPSVSYPITLSRSFK